VTSIFLVHLIAKSKQFNVTSTDGENGNFKSKMFSFSTFSSASATDINSVNWIQNQPGLSFYFWCSWNLTRKSCWESRLWPL